MFYRNFPVNIYHPVVRIIIISTYSKNISNFYRRCYFTVCNTEKQTNQEFREKKLEVALGLLHAEKRQVTMSQL